MRLLLHALLARDTLLAVRAKLQEIHGFVIEALALVPIPQRVANDAPGDRGRK